MIRSTLVWGFAASALALGATIKREGRETPPRRVHHVFILMLENESYETTFADGSLAPYLAHTLPSQGVLLRQYYGIGHASLDNYIALVSGQAPNAATQKDCHEFTDFAPTATTLDSHGQLAGTCLLYTSPSPRD